jgi:hypothetical protein
LTKESFFLDYRVYSGWEHLVNMLYAMGGGDTEDAWSLVEKFCENLDGKPLGKLDRALYGYLYQCPVNT